MKHEDWQAHAWQTSATLMNKKASLTTDKASWDQCIVLEYWEDVMGEGVIWGGGEDNFYKFKAKHAML